MKYNRAYEIVDERRGVHVDLPDDSLGFAEDPDQGTVSVMTPDGRITLVELRASNFDDTVAPFIEGPVPEFSSDDERARYLYGLIEES